MTIASGRYCLGIDIGGTSAKLAVVSAEGQIVERTAVPMGRSLSTAQIVDSLAEAVQKVLDESASREVKPEGIGIGHPGFYDEQGCLRDLCNLPSLSGVNLVNVFQERFRLRTASDTDVSCGTLGEFYFGGHREVRRFLFLTLGTGVGAGVVIDGRLMRITRNCLGDPGHLIVDPEGTPCTCGGRGCLEAIISGWAISRQAGAIVASDRPTMMSQIQRETGTIMPRDVFSAAAQGDREAALLVARVAKFLAMGLASLSILFEPERIVLGGGIAAGAGDQLLGPVSENFFQMLQPAFARHIRLRTASAGPDAGVLGAAALILNA